jgi:hypothetical protein
MVEGSAAVRAMRATTVNLGDTAFGTARQGLTGTRCLVTSALFDRQIVDDTYVSRGLPGNA